VKLNLYEWGRPGDPAIVCIHGLTAHADRYRRLAEERLADRYRVLAFDLRGHGRSSWVPPWSLETFVVDLVETAASAGVARAVWMGHSFGGRLVRELAAAHPDLVEKAILLDPAASADPEGVLERAERQARTDDAYASVEDAVASWRETVPRAPQDWLEEAVRSYLVQGEDGRWRFLYSQAAAIAIVGELTRPVSPYRGIPTLLVVAEDSQIVRAAAREALAADLGELLQVVVVPGGHSVDLDSFDETAAAVEAFLAS
jgi:lipase